MFKTLWLAIAVLFSWYLYQCVSHHDVAMLKSLAVLVGGGILLELVIFLFLMLPMGYSDDPAKFISAVKNMRLGFWQMLMSTTYLALALFNAWLLARGSYSILAAVSAMTACAVFGLKVMLWKTLKDCMGQLASAS